MPDETLPPDSASPTPADLRPAAVERRVLAIVAATKQLPVDTVTIDRSFEELGVDSLDRLNILFDLEKEFGIEINDDDARRVTSLGEMVAGVELLLAQKSGAAAESEAHPLPVDRPRP